MTSDAPRHHTEDSGKDKHSHAMYWKFGAILLVNLGLMWALSMSMVRSLDHFYFNPSNLYTWPSSWWPRWRCS